MDERFRQILIYPVSDFLELSIGYGVHASEWRFSSFSQGDCVVDISGKGEYAGLFFREEDDVVMVFMGNDFSGGVMFFLCHTRIVYSFVI